MFMRIGLIVQLNWFIIVELCKLSDLKLFNINISGTENRFLKIKSVEKSIYKFNKNIRVEGKGFSIQNRLISTELD